MPIGLAPQLAHQTQILEMVARTEPLLNTLQAIVRFVEDHEPGSRCAILSVSSDRHHFSSCVAPSFPRAFHNYFSGMSIDPSHCGVCGAAVESGHPRIVADVAADKTYSQAWRELLLTCGCQSVLSNPIWDGDTVVACLSVHFSKPDCELPKNKDLIAAATHLASLAISRENVNTTMQRRSRRANLLSSISQGLVTHDDPVLDLKSAFDAVCDEIGADLYFNYLIDPASADRLLLQTHRGLSQAQQAKFSALRVGEYLCGEIAQRKSSIILANVDHDDSERTRQVRDLGGKCYAGFPLVSRGRLHGTVAFVSRAKGAFTDDSVKLIEAITMQFAAAIDRDALLKAKALGEERLRTVIDAMPALMSVVGKNGKYEYVNAAYERWFKLPAREVVGRSMASVLGATAYEAVSENLKRALRGERVHFETDITYATAGQRYISAEYIPRPDSSGNPDGCYVLVHDLTERKRYEELLARNERVLAELIEKAPFGVYIVDADLRIMRMDEQSQIGVFKNVQPVIGRKLEEAMQILWPEEIAAQIVERFAHTLNSGETFKSKEFIERRSDVPAVESYEWEVHRIVLPDGRFGVVCYYFDSTPIRRAESLVRESERRFRHMANHAPVMIWMTELDGACSYLSKQWYDFTGQSAEEGLGTGWLEAIYPGDRIAAQQISSAAYERREEFRLEYRLRRHDGAYVWCIDAAAPRFDTDGTFLGYIGSVIDISERKQAEETQTLLLSELNHRVKNTLANVQAIAQQTLRRTRDPEQFVESFSGRLQALSKAHSMLSNASWQGADMQTLLIDQLTMGPVDVRAVEISGPSLTLTPQMALHLALVVHELATNCIKYGALSTGQGRVSIEWKTDGAKIFIKWAERGGPTVTKIGARGFGTTLIEHSARSEGGEAVMSCEKAGVVWQISLPLHRITKQFYATTPSFLRSRPEAEANKVLRGLRVVVIEDEPLVAMEIASILEEAGAEPIGPLSSCADALHKIKTGGFNLAVLDGNLLGDPVDEVAAALTRANVPFLFVSGYGRESLPRAYGHAPLLGKPFEPDGLVRALKELANPDVLKHHRDS